MANMLESSFIIILLTSESISLKLIREKVFSIKFRFYIVKKLSISFKVLTLTNNSPINFPNEYSIIYIL